MTSEQPEIPAEMLHMSVRALAPVFGVSPSTIQRMRSEANRAADAALPKGMISIGKVKGTDGKVRPSRRFDTTARDSKIIKLYGRGLTMRAIAAEVGCSVGTVHRVIAKES